MCIRDRYQRRVREIRLSTMSSDLIWQCVRTNSCFTKTRRCGSNFVQFTSEPNNLTQLNRFKDSGLANTKAVGLVADADKGVHLTLKSAKRQRQIKRNAPSAKLTGSYRKVAKAITKNTKDSYYRSDLTGAALARWHKIWKSQPKYHTSKAE
eukprot:TRINITY_DN2395_c0_g1_i1.p2 TRINITY_DN2395_c0_g1~~TRINITY_DN2395_c0_g1_i1.p2  ORF type:complete len:152 (+),score=67.31 TRINITY_DN2395_c0_g1_i1:146-601(+)